MRKLKEHKQPRSEAAKQLGFTLAEVLVTLGIICVVAALTMPTLITNYQKKETTTKLKYVRSLLTQATHMRDNDIILGNFKEMEDIPPLSPDDTIKYYNTYWKPYIKTIKTEKKEKGIIAELANGTGIYIIKHPCSGGKVTGCMYLIYCTQYKYCKNIDEANVAFKNTLNTRNKFMFWYNGKTPADFHGTRTEEIEACKKDYYYCSNIIEKDGWEIKADYPW